MPHASDHSETIRQAFSYVTRYQDRLFVVKLDDPLVDHRFFPLLIRDIALLHRLGIRIVLVPGARTRIDALLRRAHLRSVSRDGIRVTAPAAMNYVKSAAAEIANHIMAMLTEHDVNAVMGNWVHARALGVREGIDYGCTGTVDSVDTDVVLRALEDRTIPIFTNIGWGPRGIAYNISTNDLAVRLSRELHAEKLFFLTATDPIRTVSSVDCLEGIETREDGTISGLTLEQAQAYVDGAPTRGPSQVHTRLLTLALEACRGGAGRAHIIDARTDGALLEEVFSNRGCGTMVYANEHAHLRALVKADIPDVLRLMSPAVDSGHLVPRSAEQIGARLGDYVVYEVDGTLHGCAALHRYGKHHGEIAGLVVDRTYANSGTGSRIVSYLLARARALGLRQVFVLTTRSFDWFVQAGFRRGRPSNLPASRRASYDSARRSRVLLYDIDRGA